jgi:hypothetical protein
VTNIEKLKQAETVLIETSQTRLALLLAKIPALIGVLIDIVKIIRQHEEKLNADS